MSATCSPTLRDVVPTKLKAIGTLWEAELREAMMNVIDLAMDSLVCSQRNPLPRTRQKNDVIPNRRKAAVRNLLFSSHDTPTPSLPIASGPRRPQLFPPFWVHNERRFR